MGRNNIIVTPVVLGEGDIIVAPGMDSLLSIESSKRIDSDRFRLVGSFVEIRDGLYQPIEAFEDPHVTLNIEDDYKLTIVNAHTITLNNYRKLLCNQDKYRRLVELTKGTKEVAVSDMLRIIKNTGGRYNE